MKSILNDVNRLEKAYELFANVLVVACERISDFSKSISCNISINQRLHAEHMETTIISTALFSLDKYVNQI